MAKVSYASLKLKTSQEVKTFKYGDADIEVKQYLPIEDKYDLIIATLQRAKDGDLYNPLRLDVYFHLNIVYLYTNLSFTDKQKENETKLYDALMSNEIIDAVLALIPEKEYEFLIENLEDMVENEMEYSTTAASVLKSLVNDLPKNAEAAANIVDNFVPEKYQAVVDFAKAANGGRPIN